MSSVVIGNKNEEKTIYNKKNYLRDYCYILIKAWDKVKKPS